MSRINPQSIAASEYKQAARPAVNVKGQPVTGASRPANKPDNQEAVNAAMDLLKKLTGAPQATPAPAIVATAVKPGTYKAPAITIDSKGRVTAASMPAPTDNIASPNISVGAGGIAVGTCANTSCACNVPKESAEATEIRILKAKVAEVTKQYNELSGKYTKEHEELLQLRDDLDQTTAELLNSEAERDAIREQFDVDQQEVTTLQAKYDAAVESSRGRCAVLQTANERLTEQNSQLMEQVSRCGELDSVLAQLINAHENIESLEEENSALKSKVDIKDRTLNQCVRTIDEKSAEFTRISNLLHKSENEVQTLKLKLSHTIPADLKLAADHAELKAQYAKLEAMYSKLNAALLMYIQLQESNSQ